MKLTLINPFKFIFLASLITMNNIQCTSPRSENQSACDSCVTLLQNATINAPTVFVKVHAAEALVSNNYPEGLEATFTALQKAAPENFLGATRVLARLNKSNPEKYSENIELIVDKFLNADSSRQRLIALESLGKLGYDKPLPEIVALAQTGDGGFKAMARWVLANSGNPEKESALAQLLLSTEVSDYRTAAYALRFINKIQPETYSLLQRGADQLAKDAVGRVYVLSSLFVHTPPGKNSTLKSELLAYSTGETPERYETAEGLSLAGQPADIPLLEKLLKDPDMDVRVAASNAILRIQNRSKNN